MAEACLAGGRHFAGLPKCTSLLSSRRCNQDNFLPSAGHLAFWGAASRLSHGRTVQVTCHFGGERCNVLEEYEWETHCGVVTCLALISTSVTKWLRDLCQFARPVREGMPLIPTQTGSSFGLSQMRSSSCSTKSRRLIC